ncbi:MAG: hypothetical protein ACREFD_03600 [Stellaceae bacterium]
MNADRPMNEYEGALFSAVMILIGALVDLGINRPALAAKFREAGNLAAMDGRKGDAAVHEMLANIAERDAFYVPSPPFTLIKGGKDDGTSN